MLFMRMMMIRRKSRGRRGKIMKEENDDDVDKREATLMRIGGR